MDSRWFLDEFINRVNEDRIVLAEMVPSFPECVGKTFDWIYRENQSAYTELINKCIVAGIINDAYFEDDPRHLVAQHEYFRIDTIGYQHRYTEIPEEEVKAIGLKPHFWDLMVAVEHENSKSDWMDEVIKLAHIRCPLKIVVVYNYCDERSKGDLEKLNFVAKWMMKVSAYDADSKEEFLAIIGNAAPKDNSKPLYDRFDYRGYLFNKHLGTFEECNEMTRD